MNATIETITMTENASAAKQTLTNSESAQQHYKICSSEDNIKSFNNKPLKHKKRKKKQTILSQIIPDQGVRRSNEANSILPEHFDRFEGEECDVEKLSNMCMKSSSSDTSLSQRQFRRQQTVYFDTGLKFIRSMSFIIRLSFC